LKSKGSPLLFNIQNGQLSKTERVPPSFRTTLEVRINGLFEESNVLIRATELEEFEGTFSMAP